MRRKPSVVFATVAAAMLGISACAPAPTPAEVADTRAALERVLQPKRSLFAAQDGDRGHHVWQEVRRFYTSNGDQLVWTDGRRPSGTFDSLIRALHAADLEGLDPADYRVDELAAAAHTFDRARAADLDVRCTYAYLRYAWDLARGTVDPEDVMPQGHAASRDVDPHNVLLKAIGENRVEESLARTVPDVYGIDRRHGSAATGP